MHIGRSARSPESPDRIGPYVVEGRLGRGGMSVVYAARDPDSGQPVALKVVRPAIGSGEALRHAGLRMLREAWILSQVRDPNVVTVLDVVASGDEMFLVLELIEGTDLERWLCDARSGLAVPEGLGAPSAGLLMGTRNP